eukprot:SAG31_NODE_1171_length_9560_cov_11.668745_5_plen_107_part_00
MNTPTIVRSYTASNCVDIIVCRFWNSRPQFCASFVTGLMWINSVAAASGSWWWRLVTIVTNSVFMFIVREDSLQPIEAVDNCRPSTGETENPVRNAFVLLSKWGKW